MVRFNYWNLTLDASTKKEIKQRVGEFYILICSVGARNITLV